MTDHKEIWLSPEGCTAHEYGGRYWAACSSFECSESDYDPDHVCGKPTRYILDEPTQEQEAA